MSDRELNLTLRARADTKDIEQLEREIGDLSTALRKSSAAFDEVNQDARKLATTFGALTQEEQKQVTSAARVATAVQQAAAARERAAAAAANAVTAEQRSVSAQQAAEQSAIKTAIAQERLAQSHNNSGTSTARAASAEEKLAQERQKTHQATARTQKEEIAVAKAREQLRASTARAEAAEARLAKTRQSSGLALDIVKRQAQALIAGGALVMVSRQLLEFGKSSITAASDAEESAAKFQQVYKTLAGDVEDSLRAMADANRRSIYDLIDFASTLQDTFVPLGFAREQAASLSQTVVQLGIDIAAFSNKADAEVIQNLTSALVGNHEAVRSYGIVLTETVLKQELARIGAEGLTGAALETAKAQARLNIIMRSSADAMGAAVREADSYSNTVKAYDAAMQDLKVTVGEELLPTMVQLAEAAIVVVNALASSYQGSLLNATEAQRETAQSAQDLALSLAGVVKEIERTGSWFDKLKLSQGMIGNVEEVRDIFRDIALQSGSFEEFDELFRSIGVSTAYLGNETGNAAANYEEIARAFYDAAKAAETYEKALDAAGDADTVMLQRFNAEQNAVAMEQLAEQTRNYNEAVAEGEAAYAQVTQGIQDNIKWYQRLKEERAAFGESFQSAPVEGLADALSALQDVQSVDVGEWIDTQAIDTARNDIVQANRDIQASHMERAYTAISARLIEEGAFAALADIAVGLGIMTEAEADARLAYAETAAALDALTASTAFYGLTSEQQIAAVKGLAAGIYETSDAAIRAAENLKKVQDFYASGPDSSQIGAFYQSLSSSPETAVSATVELEIDPTSELEFSTWQKGLTEYSETEYITSIGADGVKETTDDFESMKTTLKDLTRNPWVIKVQYQTDGAPPTGAPVDPGPSPTGGGRSRASSYEAAAVSVRVNNYNYGGDVATQTKRGVLAALRSAGLT